MTVRIYRSTDASAPTITGQVGSLTTALDAILVNGYGSQTAAGWTINQTTTNKRGYLQNTSGSNNPSGELLYIDDTGPGAGGAREARACGFETMAAITPTGTGQFPTNAQSAIGTGQLVIRKSTTADATARAWTCIANGQTIYLFIETGDQTTPLAAFPFVFGDFFSYRASDQYAVCIIGRNAENSGSANVDWLSPLFGMASGTGILTSPITAHYADRSWTGVGGSVQFGKHIDMFPMGSAQTGTATNGSTVLNTGANGIAIGRNSSPTNFPYPNGPDGACWLSPLFMHHNGAIRGVLPGLWAPLHDRPLNHDDTFTVSTGDLNGKSFVVQAIPAFINNGTDTGQIHVETSNTWALP